MFLLMRKSDKKFWSDCREYSYIKGPEGRDIRVTNEQWTENPNKARAFKTKAGAIQSRGVSVDFHWGNNPYPYPNWNLVPDVRKPLMEQYSNWNKNRNKERLNLIHNTYEVVEIEFKVKE